MEKGKLDLEWNDDNVVPPTIYPDLEFLFRQAEHLTLQEVDAREDEYILDVGCGKAVDAAELSKSKATVIGLEPSKVMLFRAKEYLNKNSGKLALVQGIGESLPFKTGIFDKVMCKGALDHFLSPSKTMEDISRILKPDGEAIIMIANFESLGFRIGKRVSKLKTTFSRGVDEPMEPWKLPPDHTYKFDYPSLKNLLKGYFQISSMKGVSLLWGIPWWGSILSKFPKPISYAFLGTLDKIARGFPSLADIIIAKCVPFSQHK